MAAGVHKATGADKVLVEGPVGPAELARLGRYRACTQLSIRQTTLADLGLVRTLPKLASLELYRTRIADYSVLASVRTLRTLMLSGVSDHADLSFLTALPQLSTLKLLHLPKLTRLPELRGLRLLTSVMLLGCKRLVDIRALLHVPGLEHLTVVDTPHAPDDLVPLLKLRALKYVSAQFGTKRANERFESLLREHGKQRHPPLSR